MPSKSKSVSRPHNVVLPDGSQVQVEPGKTIADLIEERGIACATPAMAAYLDNYILRLDRPIKRDGRLRLVERASLDGAMIYERSLICMLQRAIGELFPGVTLTVNHSLDNQLFCELLLTRRGKRELTPPSEKDLARVEARMREFVAAERKRSSCTSSAGSAAITTATWPRAPA
jgi:hypothetical protein